MIHILDDMIQICEHICDVTCVNEACHARQGVMSHICMIRFFFFGADIRWVIATDLPVRCLFLFFDMSMAASVAVSMSVFVF